MFKVICDAIVLLLAAIGLVQILYWIISKLFNTRQENEMIILLPIHGHNNQAEFLLRSVAAKMDCLNGFKNKKVVCLDLEMDEETKQICNIISSEYDFMEVKSLEDFQKLFSEV